jgi:plasmid stabilization system protein ParE
MRDPELTDKAKDDLREIWYSLASKGDERAADRLVSRILDKCRNRARFPETGRLRE